MFIGILGGSFNPIHNGHLHIAKHVFQTLSLDKVIFIPTGDPPHKPATSLAPAHHRLEMVKLATEPCKSFEVDAREILDPMVSYSVNTVSQLKKEFPEGTKLGFIIGLDAFLEFPSWKQATYLLDICHMIVCSRPGATFSQLQALSLLPDIPLAKLRHLDQLANARLDMVLPSGSSVTLLAVPPSQVSASHIREQISLKLPIGHWLPPSVESYIIQHEVYQ